MIMYAISRHMTQADNADASGFGDIGQSGPDGSRSAAPSALPAAFAPAATTGAAGRATGAGTPGAARRAGTVAVDMVSEAASRPAGSPLTVPGAGAMAGAQVVWHATPLPCVLMDTNSQLS